MNGRIIKSLSKVISMALLAQIILPIIWILPTHASTSSPEIRIQFLSPLASVVEGYEPDYGETYGEQIGLTYGWNSDHTPYSVNEAVYGSSLLDSSINMQAGAEWEIALPSGSYDVEISVGSAVYGSNNILNVENVVFWDHVELSAGGQETVKKRVQLSDGRITLKGDSASATTSIHYVKITKIVPAIRQMSQPYISSPVVQNKIPGNNILLSGSQNNEHNAIPSIKVNELGQAVGTYLNEQLSVMENRIATMEQQVESCNGCDASGLESAILSSPNDVVIMQAGQLNLDSSATFGSPSKPVFLILNGINTNQNLTLTVYGTLVITGNLNANTKLSLHVNAPDNPEVAGKGDLWVGGTIHLNNDSTVEVAGDFLTGSLIYNNGQLNVQADRLLVSGSLHINTKVDMSIAQEMLVGSLVSNNQTGKIRVNTGDLFIRDDIHVNNHLDIQTGGVVAIGGSVTANQKPTIATGIGSIGQTKLKYTIYGLKAEYYTERELNGDRYTVVDENVNVNNKLPISITGLNDGNMSVRWTGQITPYFTEIHQFETNVRGGIKLWVNEVLVIDKWESTGNGTYSGSLSLEAGVAYDIQLEYANSGGQPQASLNWESESGSKEIVPQSQLSPFATPIMSATPTENDVAVIWTTSFNANGYELEADGIVYTLGVQSTFTHSLLDAGTLHKYRVRAISGDIKGEWSSQSDLWTLPSVPSNIRLQSTSNSVTLIWDEVVGATGYDIETYNTIIDNGNVLSYNELDLNPNIQRTFRIRAHNASGPGQWSAVVAKATLPGTSAALYTEATDTSIDVSWDVVSGADSYDVEVDGTIVSGIVGRHYLHESLQPNTTHTYRVRSRNSEGMSGWSYAVNAVTLPSTPQNLRATGAVDYIKLEWDEVTDATSYEIEVDGAIFDVGTSMSYTHSELEVNSEHTYSIRARHDIVFSNWSEKITRKTLSNVPVNLQTKSTSNEITFSWDPAIGATGYEVEVDGEVVPNGLSTVYVHAGLLPFTDHAYRVRAISSAGVGPWSELLSESTELDMPKLTAQSMSKSSVIVSWTAIPDATGYELMVDGELIDVGSVTTYLHSDLLPYSWHAYRVRAKGGSIAGPWSDALTKTTLLGTPVITRFTATSSQIIVEWEVVLGATGYEIEADTGIVDVGRATKYVHGNLLPNSNHTYRLRAKNGSDVGDWSDWSDWSVPAVKSTPPATPKNLKATASPHFIELQWAMSSGSLSYDLEIDGRIIAGITGTGYSHQDLDPNTMHTYRVRASNSGGSSPWSNKLDQRTTPELTVDVGQGSIFNFVIVVPRKTDMMERTITVTYDPEELGILDLSAATPESELTVGPIKGTNITISEISNGIIVYRITNASKTIINIIRFEAMTNEDSKITYTIE